MLTLKGKFEGGEIRLLSPPPVSDECDVLVTFVDTRHSSLSRSATHRASSGDQPDGLTRREYDVLKLMPTGRNNREIARELGISEGTTRNYVSSIYRKLEVSNRAEAVAKAVRRDLIALE